MEKNVRNFVRKHRESELTQTLEDKIKSLESKGYRVELGKLGVRTTYALLTKEDSDEEIVGYTYIKNKKYINDTVGKIKAIDQALARKDLMYPETN